MPERNESNGNVKIPRWVVNAILTILVLIISSLVANAYQNVDTRINNLAAQQAVDQQNYQVIADKISSVQADVSGIKSSIYYLNQYFGIKQPK